MNQTNMYIQKMILMIIITHGCIGRGDIVISKLLSYGKKNLSTLSINEHYFYEVASSYMFIDLMIV